MPGSSNMSPCIVLPVFVLDVPISTVSPEQLVLIFTITACKMGLKGRYEQLLPFFNALPVMENFYKELYSLPAINTCPVNAAPSNKLALTHPSMHQSTSAIKLPVQQMAKGGYTVDAGHLGRATCDETKCAAPISRRYMPAYLAKSAASAKTAGHQQTVLVPAHHFKRKDNALANKNHTKQVDAKKLHNIPKLRVRA